LTADNQYGTLAPYYDIFIDWDKRLAREIPFILAVAAGAAKSCLDLGCGTGRHLAALRAEGFRVEGCEPSPGLRSLAEKNLPGVKIHDCRMEDIDELAGRCGPWDLALCLGNTLAHLPAGRFPAFFSGLRNAVSAGGAAVVHVLSYDRIMQLRPASLASKEIEKDRDRYSFQRNYEYGTDNIRFTIEIRKNGNLLGVENQTLFPVYSASLVESARQAGLVKSRLFGGFDTGQPYTEESENLVAIFGR